MNSKLVKGDLAAYVGGYQARLHIGIYAGEGNNSEHFWPLHQSTLDRIAEGKKPYVRYITGSMTERRMVKIGTDSLDPAELKIYNQLKAL